MAKLHCWFCGQKSNLNVNDAGRGSFFCGNCGIQTLIKYPETVAALVDNAGKNGKACVLCGQQSTGHGTPSTHEPATPPRST